MRESARLEHRKNMSRPDTPAQDRRTALQREKPLDGAQMRKFRREAARIDFPSIDSVNVRFPASDLCSIMSAPCRKACEVLLIRVQNRARRLVRRTEEELSVHADSVDRREAEHEVDIGLGHCVETIVVEPVAENSDDDGIEFRRGRGTCNKLMRRASARAPEHREGL